MIYTVIHTSLKITSDILYEKIYSQTNEKILYSQYKIYYNGLYTIIQNIMKIFYIVSIKDFNAICANGFLSFIKLAS